MLTLIEILKKSEEYLSKHGIQDARHNAELLASHVLGKPRIQLYLEYDKPIGESEIVQLRAALAERKTHKPVQYIFGEAEFYGITFSLNPDVLIPRPETELLVEEALKTTKLVKPEKPVIYDVGTGSGCIAISIAKHCDNCFVYASDVSAEALKIASANSARNGVSEKIEFFLGREFRPFIDAAVPKADIIVSNPPYIKTADLNSLQPEVKDFEPRKALDGGSDGLDTIKQLIAGFGDIVNAGGILMMEIGFRQSEGVSEFIKADGGAVLLRTIKDLQGIDRIVVIEKRK